MARPIRSIDIYLPLDYNEGRPIPDAVFIALQQQLLNRFGGVTSTQRQFPLQGIWKDAGTVFQDRVIVFTVMDFESKPQLVLIRFLERLKARLKTKLDQLEILITIQELLAV
jgi:hypothetical protein